MSPPITVATIDRDPQAYEDTYVHAVYDQIASHFSSTRYKPWPIISSFLADLPTGWVGLDSGTGNGKYLPLPVERPSAVWTIGLDRSRNLLEIARTSGGSVREVVWCDVLGSSWRPEAFDYAISIATIHHLTSSERRKLAIQRLLQSVSAEHGRVLIYVWAVEQDDLSKRVVPVDSDGKHGQDVFVPWSLHKQNKAQSTHDMVVSSNENPHGDSPAVFNRFYHLFVEGELPSLVSVAAVGMGLGVGPPGTTETGEKGRGVEIVQAGWERSNHYVEMRRWQR